MKKFNFYAIALLLIIAAMIASNIANIIAGEYFIVYICLLCWNSIMFGVVLGETILGNIMAKYECDFSRKEDL